MAHPTRKHTRSRRDKRRANWKARPRSLTTCGQCAQPVLPHRACPSCGYYRGRQVVTVRERKRKTGTA
ncbi:MAG TPA: 50S ribosomal protein L32 [bacterium]